MKSFIFISVSLIGASFAGSLSAIDQSGFSTRRNNIVPQLRIEKTDTPILVNTCLITNKMQEQILFYEQILQIPAEISDSTYASFHMGAMVLALFSANAQDRYIPGSAQSASNRSAILEFQVNQVDREYLRLQPIVKTWVKQPTTQPWGTRSIYFRDPDGNLVNFFEILRAK